MGFAERPEDTGKELSDLKGTERGWNGPGQTHPSLFSCFGAAFHIAKV